MAGISKRLIKRVINKKWGLDYSQLAHQVTTIFRKWLIIIVRKNKILTPLPIMDKAKSNKGNKFNLRITNTHILMDILTINKVLLEKGRNDLVNIINILEKWIINQITKSAITMNSNIHNPPNRTIPKIIMTRPHKKLNEAKSKEIKRGNSRDKKTTKKMKVIQVWIVTKKELKKVDQVKINLKVISLMMILLMNVIIKRTKTMTT